MRARPRRARVWVRLWVTSMPPRCTDPRSGRCRPRDDVEQRGLARPVRADEARDDARLGAQRHVGERGDAAEVDAHVVDLEGRRRARRRAVAVLRRHGPPRGPGRASPASAASSPKGRCTRLVNHSMPRMPSGWRASSTIPMPAASPVRSASERGQVRLEHRERRRRHAAQQRAGQGADPPDGDEEEQRQAGEELDVVGADAALLARVEDPAEAGHGGREGEHDHLGAHRAQPDRGEGRGRVAHGHQTAAEGTAPHQPDEQGAQRGHDRHLDELGPVAHGVHERQPQPARRRWTSRPR